MSIIEINKNLSQYASAGHYNDMDMLQVGRGMSEDEDKIHFSMWCILNSPLLAGNDLESMSAQTVRILGNKELVELNQDKAFKQATLLFSDGDIDVWEKVLWDKKTKAIVLMNRGETVNYTLVASKINTKNNAKIRDLWAHQDLGKIGTSRTFKVAKHGVVVLKVK